MKAYRPIAYEYQLLQSLIYQYFGLSVCAAINLLLFGLSGFLVFLLADYLFGGYIGLITSSSFILFPQEISANWVLFGPQSLVPGLMCLSLFLYLKYLNGSQKNFVFLLLVLLLSPMFKEATGLISFVILFHYCLIYFFKTLGFYNTHLYRNKFNWIFVILMSIACFQSIFPSFFVNFLIFRNPSLISIFEMGALHDHLSALSPRESLFLDILSTISPGLVIGSLLILILTMIGLNSEKQLKLFSIRNLQKQAISIISLALIIAYILVLFSDDRSIKLLFIFSYISFLGIFFAMRYSLLIAIWLFATLLSLFSVYFNTTQLGYLATQIILIISVITGNSILAIYQITLKKKNIYKKLLHWLMRVVVFLCILSFLDNAMSVANAFSGYNSLDRLIESEEIQQSLSGQCKNAIGDRSIYLSNSPLIVDMIFHLQGNQSISLGDLRYNSFFGVPPSEVIKNRKQLQNLLIDNNIYLIRLEHPNPYKSFLWKTKDLENLFSKPIAFEISFTTYYLDPFRRLLNNRYKDLVITPDFQDEYQLEKKLMFRSIYTNTIHISYRCASKVEQDLLPEMVSAVQKIELVVDGYKKFNIIKANSLFYGLAQAEGAFNLEKIEREEYRHLLIGNSIEQVKAAIDKEVETINNSRDSSNQIQLVTEGYKQFNIIEVNDRFYGILQEDGEFTLERVKKKDYKRLLIGDSIEEVKLMIDNQ
ncbi:MULTISPECIES: hypothetical protein [Spirulina sp. CCY15215]|uniref:hypothetical protein n=1 Tax=Spirulina sp. CCY15215 TaxID=2767591 RepID=UPI00194EF162|nr:hypothetical protein [Spirulina major]